MKDSRIKEKFLELRTGGMSYSRISEALGTSKPTLIKWSKELQIEINNCRQIELESIRERVLLSKEKRLLFLSKSLSRVFAELEQRDLSAVPTSKLYEIALRLFNSHREEEQATQFKDSDIVILPTTNWEG